MENLPQWNNTVMEWYNNKLIYMEMSMWNPHNTLRLRQNGQHYADDTFKCFLLDENIWILIDISLKFVPKGPINNIPVFVLIMAWRRPGAKPLSEPMMLSLPMHICITRPQLVNTSHYDTLGLYHNNDLKKLSQTLQPMAAQVSNESCAAIC